jgi:hypothetical protein
MIHNQLIKSENKNKLVIAMINSNEKGIIFSKSDMEWIEPLFLEWKKENEGKQLEELIVELLREYKIQRENFSRYKLTLGAYEIRFRRDALKKINNTFARAQLQD